MSADNRICLMEDNCGNWCVWHGSLSINYIEPEYGSECFQTKKGALKYAYNLCKKIDILEGGVTEIDKQEQIAALLECIKDLNQRLENLSLRGSQWNNE